MSTRHSVSLWATSITESLKHGPCLMGSHRVIRHLHARTGLVIIYIRNLQSSLTVLLVATYFTDPERMVACVKLDSAASGSWTWALASEAMCYQSIIRSHRPTCSLNVALCCTDKSEDVYIFIYFIIILHSSGKCLMFEYFTPPLSCRSIWSIVERATSFHQNN